MKNDSNPIIRSEEITIDMHICAALSESGGSGEIYFAAIAPDMELTVITLDEAPDILPCFDEDDAYLNIPDSSLLLSYNPVQVLKLAGKHYLTGPVILVRTNMDGEFISLSCTPPRYLIFFKAQDADALNAAFKEYSAAVLNKAERPSVLAKLHDLAQVIANLPDKVRHKEEERGL